MKRIILVVMLGLVGLVNFGNACDGKNIITKSPKNAYKSISVNKKEQVRVIKIKLIGKAFTKVASYYKCLNGSFEGKTYFIRFDAMFREYESSQLKEYFDAFDNYFANYEEYIVFSSKRGLSEKEKEAIVEKYSEEIEKVSGGHIFLDED